MLGTNSMQNMVRPLALHNATLNNPPSDDTANILLRWQFQSLNTMPRETPVQLPNHACLPALEVQPRVLRYRYDEYGANKPDKHRIFRWSRLLRWRKKPEHDRADNA